ncbi:MAG: hypothetical protein ACFFFG_11135 [Candidatus Thorarchaeota archaeon]
MDILSTVLLLITGILALVMGALLIKEYLSSKNLAHLAWSIGFIVLFASGLLIIIFDFAILTEPLVPVVAALIPGTLAIGLLFAVWPDKPYGLLYTIYTVVVVGSLAIVRIAPELSSFSTPVLMAIHIPSGLLIVIIPIITAWQKETEITSIFFGIGGLLISTGGILLAFLKLGSPILTQEQIFAVLPLLLVLVGIFFVLGIILPSKWKIEIPLLG